MLKNRVFKCFLTTIFTISLVGGLMMGVVADES